MAAKSTHLILTLFGKESSQSAKVGKHMHNCMSYLLKYDLKDLALIRFAKIVHTADVAADIDQDSIARGLEAIATGFGLCYPDNTSNLARQFEVYDSLYAWCRLQIAQKQ